MYTQALETDLKAIFKTKRVDVGRSVESCIEQGILCVDIERADIAASEGRAFGRVEGTVGLRGTLKDSLSGMLAKKINEAPAGLVSRFWFSAREERTAFGPVEQELKGYKVKFIYFYREEYNPPRGPLAGASWRLKVNDVWKYCCNFFNKGA